MTGQPAVFDPPGPRARRRHALLTAVGVMACLAGVVLVIRRLADASQLDRSLWTPFLDPQVWTEYLIPGLWGTLRAAALAIVLAGVLGLLLGVGRLSRTRPVRWACGLAVEFFRAVPVLIMMIFAFSVYARAHTFPSPLTPLAAVVTGLTLYNGSVIAELIRSGVHGLPAGQVEAGLSIGLTRGQTLRAIQLPQALTAMLPALIGQLVVVLKDSALGYGITYLELLNWSKTLGSAYANTVPAYLVAAGLFIAVNYALTRVAEVAQRRVNHRGGRPVDPRGTGGAGGAVSAPAPWAGRALGS